MKKECSVCKNTFECIRSTAKYCSLKCSNNTKRAKLLSKFEKFPKLREEYLNKKRTWHREYYIKNKDKYKGNPEEKKKWNMERRLKVLQYYSENEKPFCNCCGVDEIKFLSIDHINNDGNEHRKTARRLVDWIIKNDYPEGFQILCHNCNCSKGFYGECPHEVKRKNKNMNANKNCSLCENTGVKHIENGPDDFDEEVCPCQEVDMSGADNTTER